MPRVKTPIWAACIRVAEKHLCIRAILTLGKAAVTAVKSTLEAKIAELDKWAEVSASCD